VRLWTICGNLKSNSVTRSSLSSQRESGGPITIPPLRCVASMGIDGRLGNARSMILTTFRVLNNYEPPSECLNVIFLSAIATIKMHISWKIYRR
jgi:hypothetical protein